ncbi:MAG: KH domain-containing protein, partial [Patescibacteria group bacterium]
IIPNIVNHPEDVVITEESADGVENLSIKVNPEDMGRVIGKSGKVIKAIRQIGRIIAIKKGLRVNIDVVDEKIQNTPAETPVE